MKKASQADYIETMMITSFSSVIVGLVYVIGAIWFGLKFDSNIEQLCLLKNATSRFFSWANKDSRYFVLLGLMVMFWPLLQLWLFYSHNLER